VPLASKIVGRTLRLPAPLTEDVEVEADIAVPMDDGVVLLADRYTPRHPSLSSPMPTVLVRSPYGRKGWVGLIFGRLLAERGLQVLVQSVRGTFGSGGTFEPFDERTDGLATLRWLREQPWHTGRIGTTGPSYMGLVQWAIADEVDVMAPSVTASEFRNQAYGGGSISLDLALTWLLVLDVQERRLGPVWMLQGIRRTLPRVLSSDLPVGQLDEKVFGRAHDNFRRWLEESAPDSPYWSSHDFSSNVGVGDTPVQLVGGWHDIFLPWMIEDWRALRARGRETQLIIGPGAHTSVSVQGVSSRESIAWLRAHLLGDARLVRDTPVRVFVGGGGGWRDLPDFPPPGTREAVLHLQPGGGLDAPAPGADAAAAGPSRFEYDPADPTPAVGGPMLMEQRPVRDNGALEARDDVLVFTSSPLNIDQEAIGPVRADVFFRSSLEDTDVFVRVCDVDPDGVSRNVTDGLSRLTPGEPRRDADGVAWVQFELWPTAHRFKRGHRVRVQVSSGAHPRYARNPGTGESPLTAVRLVKASQEVFHDAQRPSSVTLTVV